MSAFDPEIMMRNLPEDIKPLVDQVSANVNDAVQKVVGEFKTQAGKIAEDFEAGRFPAELQASLEKISAAHAADLDNLRASIAEVAALANDLRKFNQDISPNRLSEIARDLTSK